MKGRTANGAVLMVLLAGLAGCGDSLDAPPTPSSIAPTTTTLTAPPTVTESVDVAPLLAIKPCSLIDRDLLRRWSVDVKGIEYTREGAHICRWEEDGMAGIGLGISVLAGRDPLHNYDHPEAQVIEIGGFPAILVAVKPDYFCDIAVKTAPTQGFSVGYGALDQTVDACGGARDAAEYLARKLRAK